RSTTDLDTFYVVTAREPLALDFYFDSDAAAAVMQFTCERLGRRVLPIAMDRRTQFVHPQLQWQPMADGVTLDHTAPPQGSTSGPRVGFAPATVAHQELILESLHDVGCEILLFPSTLWSPPDSYTGIVGEPNLQICRLSAQDDSQSAAVA